MTPPTGQRPASADVVARRLEAAFTRRVERTLSQVLTPQYEKVMSVLESAKPEAGRYAGVGA